MAEGFSGMNELVQSMLRLPEDLKGEAGKVITATANAMEVELRSGYGRVTGNLIKRITVKRLSPLRIKVESRAPHAHLVEYGTVLRRHKSGKSVGTMPARPVFVPAAVRRRRRMMEAFFDLLRRAKVRQMSGSAT